MMKARTKTLTGMFKRHLVRLLTVAAIVAVSVGFTAGISEVDNKINIAEERFYQDANVADLYVKCTRVMTLGNMAINSFLPNEIADLKERFGEENVLEAFSMETKTDCDWQGKNEQDIARIYSFDASSEINALELLEGKMPEKDDEILAERGTYALQDHEVGDEITVMGSKYTVCGIVLNPYVINNVGEPSFAFEDEDLASVFYLDQAPPMTNDVFITIDDRKLFGAFSEKYEEKMDDLKEEVTAMLGEDNVAVLTIYENFGLYSLHSYADKVGIISVAFAAFFLAVTLLVVYSAIARMLDEERQQIACMKTLGHWDLTIVSKYILFAAAATILGIAAAFGVSLLLTELIYNAFNLQYHMPPFPALTDYNYFLYVALIVVAGVLLLTLLVGLKTVKHRPVVLLTPKAPKSGKKVLIERIPLIWNRLSFKYKSSVRNVFLFKSRFFMTVISIMGATVLVFAGMALMDCSHKIANGDSLSVISAALIIFSAVLCALVIYNITNINVSERRREIATLMVLGYQDVEVAWYIFREIYIMCGIGALLGLPLGAGFIQIVFNMISIGALSDVNWWTWVLAPLVTMLFGFLSTMTLYKKIVSTDMNASLKTLE